MKTYVGIARDHSVSIRSYGLEGACTKDYNAQIAAIQAGSTQYNQDSIVSVVRFSDVVEREVVNSPVGVLTPITTYRANGGSTRLCDGIGELISIFEKLPDANDPNVAFLIMAITDGEENSSRTWRSDDLQRKMHQLQGTDRWTFTIRVPRGFKRALVQRGFYEGNVFEWEQTQQGLQIAEAATSLSVGSYYAARSRGVTMTKSFYTTDLSNVNIKAIQTNLTDISKQISEWKVNTDTEAQMQIREFAEKMSGKPMLRGAAFYELVKKEDEVQEYKLIMIRDRATRAVYCGPNARQLLNLPTSGTIQLRPGDHAAYDVFIQSTSVNRKLPVGTTLMYWPNVGVGYIEGKSAPVVSSSAVKTARKVGDPSQLVRKQQIAAGIVPTTPSGGDWNAGYTTGYKHGRGKQANLTKNGTFAGNASAYQEGFTDGKAKKASKVK